MEEKKFAVLIDSDNISAKYISCILDEMTKYGVVTYRRIYGDWTNNQASSWRTKLIEHSLTPIQQFANTVGKNATDSALIIDAMDILYTDSVDGFCIVSSDSDFTRLASRFRESGKEVIGMGEKKTPRSFRNACSLFRDLELLYSQPDEEQGKEEKGSGSGSNSDAIDQGMVENAIIEIITENNNSGKETGLGEIGSQLQKKYSDFDVRNYGYSQLSTFIEDVDSLVLKKNGNSYFVHLKENRGLKDKVKSYACELVRSAGSSGMELAVLGQKIHSRFPNFKVKEFGYATLSKFIQKHELLEIRGDSRKIVYLRQQ
ncbi:MAG: NYN domain-containing protein [Lachnospiraceae bacterium]|jgi:uncharacterized protein (TIGR00288 family)|uniref:NYN domain-containing protein n=1 Tax=Clostridium sp. (strain SY8519) TaxID=1042156 RepID=UPI000217211E|nr:NYN domain-containing protein [Clostridium sp. SY8519]MCI1655643.1 NYN domain-containing protein [Lachnospiraceae bacterium]MCI1657880.1 NYN domain-containing protein [Lachnospiraceae bacterium]MCI2196313.1 NYN domain-containing protein [Lachnospiraceae bacterium]BAK46255.1 uncharacterized ACR protein [Clostridium sp. SY8519]